MYTKKTIEQYEAKLNTLVLCFGKKSAETKNIYLFTLDEAFDVTSTSWYKKFDEQSKRVRIKMADLEGP